MKKGLFKKIISMTVACAVMLSAMPLALAEDNEELKEVILSVKSKVEIPTELTEFQSDVHANEKTGKKSYELIWSIEDADEKYGNPEYDNQLLAIGVSADDKGVISRIEFERSDIYSYIYENSGKLSSVTKEDVIAKATDLLSQYSPEHKDNMKLAVTNPDGITHNVSFEYLANGLPVEGDGAAISLVELEGSLVPVSYTANVGENKEFPSPESAIGIDRISEIIKNDNPYKLNYHNGKYISRGNYELLLQYSLEDRNDTVYYDAVTGEVIKPDYAIRFSASNAAMKEESAADMAVTSGSGSLTEQEIAELDAIEGLCSIEELEKYLKSIEAFDIPDDYKLSSSRISKQDNEYFADLAFSEEEQDSYGSASVKINAKTKEIVSFYGDTIDIAADKKYEKLSEKEIAELESIADNFVNTYMKSKASSLEKKKQEYSEYNYPARSVHVTYTRTLSDIPYLNNAVGVSVDSAAKKITYVSSNWTDLKQIPSAENVLSGEEIADKIVNDIGLHLCYVRLDGVPTLAYTLNRTGVNFDAVTGEEVQYNGSKIEKDFSGYSDIDGHWAEGIITKLSENGVYVNSDTFRPDEDMSQLDFLKLVMSIDGYVPTDVDDLYEMLIRQDVLTAEEKAPEKPVTRAEAVTYLLKMNGYSNISKIKGVFVCGFADDSEIAEDMYGFVAAAKGLGLVQGDENNFFNPNAALKRAEAAVIIYNMMK